MPRDTWNGWVWPTPVHEDGRRPRVSSGFGPRVGGAFKVHYGADLTYRRRVSGAVNPPTQAKHYEHPAGYPCYATGPGVVWSVHGDRVSIDHGMVPGFGPLLTKHMHLARVYVSKGQRVEPGTIIGEIGNVRSPSLIHDHFEMHKTDMGPTWREWAFDPAPYLDKWEYLGLDGRRYPAPNRLPWPSPPNPTRDRTPLLLAATGLALAMVV